MCGKFLGLFASISNYEIIISSLGQCQMNLLKQNQYLNSDWGLYYNLGIFIYLYIYKQYLNCVYPYTTISCVYIMQVYDVQAYVDIRAYTISSLAQDSLQSPKILI